ncbi:radical SAM protein [Candidatus Woesearchaeota archaeon]|nr:radical SAM protein [Candidatus Woesearchaeota archaeon]
MPRKILLVYAPFCMPTVMPYSTSYLKGFLSNNLNVDVHCLDLNAKFHRMRFPQFYERLGRTGDMLSQGELLSEFDAAARPLYAENNKRVVNNAQPELYKELLSAILDKNPDIVAFSIVYSSQCFYALALINALKKKGVNCVAGGPAVSSKIGAHVRCMKNEVELLQYAAEKFGGDCKKFEGKAHNCSTVPDFSDYNKDDYLTKDIVIPVKTCSTCFYKQCAFCAHFADVAYLEYDLENIKRTIVKSGARSFFFIDDMITKQRLMEIAAMMKPLKVRWWCQLRPTKDLLGSFKELYDSGLRSICWGIESGNQRILDLMKKGTIVEDIKSVLKESHEAGIKNTAYIMFGFPGETKAEFLDTINFLKNNDANIDLVSPSIFGLQKRSAIYKNPGTFGITNITTEKRTVLDERISYKVEAEMDREYAKKMRGKYIKMIRKINKLPRAFAAYKEQVLVYS